MRLRAVLAASGLLVVAALSDGASAATVTVKDVVGDANGVNGQGFVPGLPGENTATPGSQPGYDVASVTFSSTFTGSGRRQVPKDLVIRLELAGEPLRKGVVYFVDTGRIGDCEMGLLFEFAADLEGRSTSQIRTCPVHSIELFRTIALSMPVFGERSVTWTVPYSRILGIPQAPLRVGDPLPDLGAETRFAGGAGNAPVMDTLTSTVSYRLGS